MLRESHKVIKASFRGNPPEERKLFPTSTCLMPISVGQLVHEGWKLEAVIKLVNSSFKQCTILIDDTVQRHTLAIASSLEPKELYCEALELGDQWLVRNQEKLSELTIPYQIARWDDWLEHWDFNTRLLQVKELYKCNQVYKDAIHVNINRFLARFVARNDYYQIDPNRAFDLCLDYLLEECAVMCLWSYECYDFELYPSGRNQAMSATYELLIKPQYPHYLRPVAIRFKKYLKEKAFLQQLNALDGMAVDT